MNYTLHQLRVFQAICEEESITKASKALHLTQPAVSIQLKKLQEQFEFPLTEVIGRKLYITEFGKEIAAVSARVLQEAEALKATADQYKGLLTGSITLSVVSTGKYVMPYFLKSFAEKYPKVNLQIDVTNKTKVIRSMEENKTDFGLVSVLPDELDVVSEPLMENKLYLVKSASRTLPTTLKPKDLEDLPLVMREEGSATRKAMTNYLKTHEIKPNKTWQLVSNEAAKQAVLADLGISIMPLIGLRNELKAGLIEIVPLKGLPIVTLWNLIHLKGKVLSPASAALLEHIKMHKEELVEENFSWVR
ncbi:MAG: LysR family transcriptional regulator [Flavobacteriales bacterium]|nr:LysR family transcriptional regulator [Flavobacteriales bacterium]